MVMPDIISVLPEIILVVTALVLIVLESNLEPPRAMFAPVALSGLVIAMFINGSTFDHQEKPPRIVRRKGL